MNGLRIYNPPDRLLGAGSQFVLSSDATNQTLTGDSAQGLILSGNTTYAIRPNVASGTTAVAFSIDQQAALTHAGARLFRLRNAGTELANIRIGDPVFDPGAGTNYVVYEQLDTTGTARLNIATTALGINFYGIPDSGGTMSFSAVSGARSGTLNINPNTASMDMQVIRTTNDATVGTITGASSSSASLTARSGAVTERSNWFVHGSNQSVAGITDARVFYRHDTLTYNFILSKAGYGYLRDANAVVSKIVTETNLAAHFLLMGA